MGLSFGCSEASLDSAAASQQLMWNSTEFRSPTSRHYTHCHYFLFEQPLFLKLAEFLLYLSFFSSGNSGTSQLFYNIWVANFFLNVTGYKMVRTNISYFFQLIYDLIWRIVLELIFQISFSWMSVGQIKVTLRGHLQTMWIGFWVLLTPPLPKHGSI